MGSSSRVACMKTWANHNPLSYFESHLKLLTLGVTLEIGPNSTLQSHMDCFKNSKRLPSTVLPFKQQKVKMNSLSFTLEQMSPLHKHPGSASSMNLSPSLCASCILY